MPFALLLAAQFAADPAPPAPFTADKFRAHVAYLASDELEGRGVGEPGGVKAADYMQRELARFGAKPGGPAGEWYQKFPFGSKRTIDPASRLTIGGGKTYSLEGAGGAMLGSADGDVAAELVAVGAGLDKDLLAGKAQSLLAGKIAVVVVGTPEGISASEVPAFEETLLGCEASGAKGIVALRLDLPASRRRGFHLR
ncbi:MAG TPA: hypothetical protein VNC50_00115, partial [Planctomycetia bacterium]|nr:hypothetical protein [Planctomycetia bacterium]